MGRREGTPVASCRLTAELSPYGGAVVSCRLMSVYWDWRDEGVSRCGEGIFLGGLGDRVNARLTRRFGAAQQLKIGRGAAT